MLAVESDGVDARRVEAARLGRAAREAQHGALGAGRHGEGVDTLLRTRGQQAPEVLTVRTLKRWQALPGAPSTASHGDLGGSNLERTPPTGAVLAAELWRYQEAPFAFRPAKARAARTEGKRVQHTTTGLQAARRAE